MLNKLIYFFNKESSREALRNILTICIPSIVVYYCFSLNIAIAFAVGIILSALTDIPGNFNDKKLTAYLTIPTFFIAGLCASMSLIHLHWLIVVLLAFFGFICNFVLVLGPRIGVIGNLTLIVISFTLGLKPTDAWTFTLALTAGSLTFFIISIIQTWLSPNRSLKYAMDDGFENMANLIRLKVNCYDEKLPLDNVYKALSLIHIKVSEQLEIVRSLLLREKNIENENSSKHAVWISKIYKLIDLYELLMANDYDYETIRTQLHHTNTLPIIRATLLELAAQIAQISSNKGISKKALKNSTIHANIKKLKDIQQSSDKETAGILLSILEHIAQVQNIIDTIQTAALMEDASWISNSNYKSFVSSQMSFDTLKKNFTTGSPIFMYSMRMSILLTVAAFIGYLLPEYRYASWIILTIILVARPSYLITQKRNFQRITGSIIGLILSVIILYFVKDIVVLLLITAVSLYAFYLFNKPNYLTCVIFITITIIISLSIHEGNTSTLLGSRFAFTLVGSLFALLGCLIIPINHSKTVDTLSQSLISNYKRYLAKINQSKKAETIDFYQLRLVRKHAQTNLAQFYDAMDQYLKDPRNKRIDNNKVNLSKTLAYRINALLIGLSLSITKSSTLDTYADIDLKINSIDLLIDELNTLANTLLTRKN